MKINLSGATQHSLASAHRRRRALSFWHQKETKNAG